MVEINVEEQNKEKEWKELGVSIAADTKSGHVRHPLQAGACSCPG